MTEPTVRLRLSQGEEITMPRTRVHHFRTLESMLGDLETDPDGSVVIPIHASHERCLHTKYVQWVVDVYGAFDESKPAEQLRLRYDDTTWCMYLYPYEEFPLDILVCVIKFLSFLDAPLMRGWLMKMLARRHTEAMTEKTPPLILKKKLSWEFRRRLLWPLWRRLQQLWQALDENLQEELWQALNMGGLVACGLYSSLFLTHGGFYAAGNNESGQLGNGADQGLQQEPFKSNIDPSAVRQLVCGTYCSFVLEDEVLQGAGRNDGRLGLDPDLPLQVTAFMPILLPLEGIRGCTSAMDHGHSNAGGHSFVWTDRALMATGQNDDEQLGTKFYREKESQRVVQSTEALPDDLYDEVTTLRYFTPINLALADTEIIQSVVCGLACTYVVVRDTNQTTRLLVCGYNGNGRLGINTSKTVPFLTEVKDAPQHIALIACGTGRCLLLTHSGELYSTGANHYGESGLGEISQTPRFTRVTEAPTSIAQICCGPDHTLLLTRRGELWACGRTSHGAFGISTKTNPVHLFTHIKTAPPDLVFIATGVYHSVVVKHDGRFYGAGGNGSGQLALGKTYHRPGKFTLIPLFDDDDDNKRKNTTEEEQEKPVKKQRLHCIQCGIGCATVFQDERRPTDHYCNVECYQRRYDFSSVL